MSGSKQFKMCVADWAVSLSLNLSVCLCVRWVALSPLSPLLQSFYVCFLVHGLFFAFAQSKRIFASMHLRTLSLSVSAHRSPTLTHSLFLFVGFLCVFGFLCRFLSASHLSIDASEFLSVDCFAVWVWLWICASEAVSKCTDSLLNKSINGALFIFVGFSHFCISLFGSLYFSVSVAYTFRVCAPFLFLAPFSSFVLLSVHI